MALPDFVVVGAPDAGTSSLHAALACHPGLAMSSVAEPGFFLTAGRSAPATQTDSNRPACVNRSAGAGRPDEALVWLRPDYEALFPRGGQRRPCGESTPYYLADFPAQRRMHEHLPYLRMIAILRDPVERAYANWLAQRHAGLEPLATLTEGLDAEAARGAAGWNRRWRYRELGRYGAQLQRLYTLFAPGQVLLVRYRDLVVEPETVLRRVCAFVGVTDAVPGRIPGRTLVPAVVDPLAADPPVADPLAAAVAELRRHLRPGPPPPPGLRARVLDRFRDDIILLGQVTGRPFEEWMDHGDLPLSPHAERR